MASLYYWVGVVVVWSTLGSLVLLGALQLASWRDPHVRVHKP